MRQVKVTNETRGNVVGYRIEVAETSWTRMRGLLGRKGLNAGGGLWIMPSSGVHTLFMGFPIDVVGLDKQRRVVRLWGNLVPWRLTSVSMALSSVIELPAGAIADLGIQIGDQLEITAAS